MNDFELPQSFAAEAYHAGVQREHAVTKLRLEVKGLNCSDIGAPAPRSPLSWKSSLTIQGSQVGGKNGYAMTQLRERPGDPSNL